VQDQCIVSNKVHRFLILNQLRRVVFALDDSPHGPAPRTNAASPTCAGKVWAPDLTQAALQLAAHKNPMQYSHTTLTLALALCSLFAGCAAVGEALPASGPSRTSIVSPPPANSIRVVDLTPEVAERGRAIAGQRSFSESLAASSAPAYVVGAGDVLDVSVWEAPPAALFSPGTTLDKASGAHANAFPELMVDTNGSVTVPFAGQVPVAGKTPQQIEQEIVARLKGKANQPQVLVRIARNVTANVTVVGEVGASMRVPLTAKGERLLDALAAAGGTKQPVNKVTVQITRGNMLRAMSLEAVIRDPAQNVPLLAGDVVTFLHQPLSFTALGSTGRNEEVPFEAQGISLAQALGRAGGVVDARADARGVFVFRFEDAAALGGASGSGERLPVVYRADLSDPTTFFSAQRFAVRNGDVLYIANAPSVELQKFLGILVSSIYTVRGIVDLAP
jgi:polysaccharide export outer membrane protein